MLKRDGKVYTVVVENTKITPYSLLLNRKIMPDSIVYTDYYRSYNILDVSESNHFRINHSTHFSESKNHINGIENFCNQAKERSENIT
ncbi:hypothetical protein C3Z13_08840 [Avibacterium endocarditidis]|uniref:ISXO2-like transposase domain-containing protein n=1 Tax=Avibacterium endocarditidis TaxID=380674 RepID=A0ABX4ZQY5_9PAST|nr:hypothetical protein C3Z13_08840 [Avibacterium endocarditidis]